VPLLKTLAIDALFGLCLWFAEHQATMQYNGATDECELRRPIAADPTFTMKRCQCKEARESNLWDCDEHTHNYVYAYI